MKHETITCDWCGQDCTHMEYMTIIPKTGAIPEHACGISCAFFIIDQIFQHEPITEKPKSMEEKSV